MRGLRRQQGGGLRVDVERTGGEQEVAPSTSSTSVLARSFRPASPKPRRRALGSASPRTPATLEIRQVLERFAQRSIVAPADVVAVEVFELGEIEARRRVADRGRSNHSIISSVDKISWSPWLQPSRTR